MGKIKILKNNKKSQFMIGSLLAFFVVSLTYSLTLLFSPIINNENILQINTSIIEQEFSKFLLIFLYNGKSIILAENDIIIYWLPLALSSLGMIVMIFRLIIHLVGYKAKTKKGIARIVRPIRSYQLTMIFAWIIFSLLTISMFLSLLSASPFLMGIVLEFGSGNFISINKEATSKVIEILQTQPNQIYWLTFALFSQIPGAAAIETDNKTFELIMWFVLPIILPFISILIAFAGNICGECSWWRINLIVLKDIDLQTGANLVESYSKVEKPKIKESKESKDIKEIKEVKEINQVNKIKVDYDPKIEKKCILFYKNLVKMLENSNNKDSLIYKETIEKLEIIAENKENDWNTIATEVEAQMNIFTSTDKQFVDLIEQIILNPRLDFFGRYKKDLEELIEGYRFALKTWDLFAAEIKLEQIFAIAFRNQELLPKIGFCLKNKINSNFKNIDQKTNVIGRLEIAKNNKDYKNYREICTEIIKEMSPIKPIISSYVDKIIYN
ncbi:hypothetical protein [Spiroplasma diminutum]|uniref:Transmembrane protein n=1 Tax=Spiroplasma diminutum CUAS-1 TaxID=1276221 RepID=S5MJK0_9MOLU|nr:hypothetical protein [Spiroplasma diminutum]AGR42150.1 hypothetical protein SDIMI_v3c04460 [Spiroplasma diminutum CUAS-1]